VISSGIVSIYRLVIRESTKIKNTLSESIRPWEDLLRVLAGENVLQHNFDDSHNEKDSIRHGFGL